MQSVKVCEAPTTTNPSKDRLLQVSLTYYNSYIDLILSAVRPK